MLDQVKIVQQFWFLKPLMATDLQAQPFDAANRDIKTSTETFAAGIYLPLHLLCTTWASLSRFDFLLSYFLPVLSLTFQINCLCSFSTLLLHICPLLSQLFPPLLLFCMSMTHLRLVFFWATFLEEISPEDRNGLMHWGQVGHRNIHQPVWRSSSSGN